jgi:hypothetical protein
VLRYAPLHQGSDEAVRTLEAARLQGRFERVLDVRVARQPGQAKHGAPNLAHVWRIAGVASLDAGWGREDRRHPQADCVLQADTTDLQSFGFRQTPTFFVNTRPLLSSRPRRLYELILTS